MAARPREARSHPRGNAIDQIISALHEPNSNVIEGDYTPKPPPKPPPFPPRKRRGYFFDVALLPPSTILRRG